MDAAHWAEVERLFLEASARPPSEREPFLQASAGDPEALAEVRALLAAEAEAEAFFAAPSPALALLAEGGPPAEGEPEDDLPEGTRVGPYRVEGEVGRGGMGSVYRARRADGAFEQTVAVKVVRRGLDTADVLRRFRQERALLAGLDHPHVARLLDGGSTADGRPYLAMEYVAGEPITAYADRQGLGVEARLRLFLQVCDAVAYAHRRLVVHRDLKPSNVLVTEEGGAAVKLLDFGIAKLLGDETEDAPLTRTGHALLTPEYAAPEQITGAPVTTSADVYALGVVLYELLAGARPARPTPARPSSGATSTGSPSSPAPPRPATARGSSSSATASLRRRRRSSCWRSSGGAGSRCGRRPRRPAPATAPRNGS
jgi:eukaryotic-like serine/threonine-protein kinase